MGKIIQYSITLYPAKRDGAFIVTSADLSLNPKTKYPNKTFESDSVKAMLEQVTTFAAEHGESCNASVRCLAPRKPTGFDKLTKYLYFNLDPVASA